jgi:hypothetical protein
LCASAIADYYTPDAKHGHFCYNNKGAKVSLSSVQIKNLNLHIFFLFIKYREVGHDKIGCRCSPLLNTDNGFHWTLSDESLARQNFIVTLYY